MHRLRREVFGLRKYLILDNNRINSLAKSEPGDFLTFFRASREFLPQRQGGAEVAQRELFVLAEVRVFTRHLWIGYFLETRGHLRWMADNI